MFQGTRSCEENTLENRTLRDRIVYPSTLALRSLETKEPMEIEPHGTSWNHAVVPQNQLVTTHGEAKSHIHDLTLAVAGDLGVPCRRPTMFFSVSFRDTGLERQHMGPTPACIFNDELGSIPQRRCSPNSVSATCYSIVCHVVQPSHDVPNAMLRFNERCPNSPIQLSFTCRNICSFSPKWNLVALGTANWQTSWMKTRYKYWHRAGWNPTIVRSGWSADSRYGKCRATELPGCSVRCQIWRTKHTKTTILKRHAMRLASRTLDCKRFPRGLTRVFNEVPRAIHTCRLQGSPLYKSDPGTILSTYWRATRTPNLGENNRGFIFANDCNAWKIHYQNIQLHTLCILKNTLVKSIESLSRFTSYRAAVSPRRPQKDGEVVQTGWGWGATHTHTPNDHWEFPVSSNED